MDGVMSDLSQRAKGYETQYERDLDRRFRTINRRNRLLGLWAAEAMGMPSTQAMAYARDLITSDVSDTNRQQELHDRVYADLHRHGVDLSDHRLRRKMDHLLAVAREQIREEDEVEAHRRG